MPQPIVITGEAGSGKTTTLMERANVLGPQLLTQPHQRALGLAVMHGARKRLQSTFLTHCPKVPVTVSTLHSFALAVVNRWRRSLDIRLPVTACETTCGLSEKHLRTQATFDEVMSLACTLLQSVTVRRTIASTYPLVVIDEFQDCGDDTLQFAQSLGSAGTLLLAADEFQMLNDGAAGCPAIEWVLSLREHGHIDYEELPGSRRTDSPGILKAARALRDNVKANEPTVPVYYAPDYGPAAYRIVERFTGWNPSKTIGTGTCALIGLSLGDRLLEKLLASFQKQLARHNGKRTVRWSQLLPEQQQQHSLCAELGITGGTAEIGFWDPNLVKGGSFAAAVVRDIERFSKLRGIAPIPQELAIQFAKLAVHNSRAFGRSLPQFQVLTVHGAKNLEFDHVFVFWSYKSAKWSPDEQRRLLYNAITRAKKDCTVLVLGDKKRTEDDPAISLLGPAQPAIDLSRSKKPARKKVPVARI